MTTTEIDDKGPSGLERMWTLAELAEALRIQPNKAYELRSKDQWPHHKVGSKLLFTYADYEAIKEIYRRQPGTPPSRRTRRTRP